MEDEDSAAVALGVVDESSPSSNEKMEATEIWQEPHRRTRPKQLRRMAMQSWSQTDVQ